MDGEREQPRAATQAAPVMQRFERCDDVLQRVALPGGGIAVVRSLRCPGADRPNEDCAAVFSPGPRHQVLAVADGVGGQPSGTVASMLALRALEACIERRGDSEGALREAILEGFDQANRAVIDSGGGSATTLVVLEVREQTVRSYHVGDSAALAFGGRGKVKLQTVAHSPVGYALEAGLLSESDALEHDDLHLVSNVVGDASMHVGMSSALRLRPRDTVVVGSDGLFDNMYVSEIVELMRRSPLEACSETLSSVCVDRMTMPVVGTPSKPDDLTFIAYRSPPQIARDP